MNRVVLF
jgi:hypothetical protein